MKRLLIYCEGQTEEMVVERLLRPYLQLHGVKVDRPILAATSQDPQWQRGGFVNWDAIQRDLRQIFVDDSDANLRFTTLLDVYAMPTTVLRLAGFNAPVTAVVEVEAVEKAIEGALNEPRFKAYLQRHEFEALVLAAPDALELVFPRHRQGVVQLRVEVAQFANAEDINHGPTTHPFARLVSAVPSYQDLKASHAYFVLAQTDFGTVRAKCPRFDAWLKHWEDWGAQP